MIEIDPKSYKNKFRGTKIADVCLQYGMPVSIGYLSSEITRDPKVGFIIGLLALIVMKKLLGMGGDLQEK